MGRTLDNWFQVISASQTAIWVYQYLVYFM